MIFWEVFGGIIAGWLVIQDLKAGRYVFLLWVSPIAAAYWLDPVFGVAVVAVIGIGASCVALGRWNVRRRLRPLEERCEQLWHEAEQEWRAKHPENTEEKMISIAHCSQREEWTKLQLQIIGKGRQSKHSQK